jgi:hypothetical protein
MAGECDRLPTPTLNLPQHPCVDPHAAGLKLPPNNPVLFIARGGGAGHDRRIPCGIKCFVSIGLVFVYVQPMVAFRRRDLKARTMVPLREHPSVLARVRRRVAFTKISSKWRFNTIPDQVARPPS